jgi:ferredoxin
MVFIIVPSLFIDMFGCKYLCPVGAASNIFKYTLVFVGCSLLLWILRSADVNVPIPVYVGVMCAIGYLLEIFTCKAEYNVSLLHIHRDKNKCTQCGECKKACPYSVNVCNVTRVVDIDCNLCGECVSECKEDALKVGICNTREGQNQIKGQWLPLLVVVIFILVMCYITSRAI